MGSYLIPHSCSGFNNSVPRLSGRGVKNGATSLFYSFPLPRLAYEIFPREYKREGAGPTRALSQWDFFKNHSFFLPSFSTYNEIYIPPPPSRSRRNLQAFLEKEASRTFILLSLSLSLSLSLLFFLSFSLLSLSLGGWQIAISPSGVGGITLVLSPLSLSLTLSSLGG